MSLVLRSPVGTGLQKTRSTAHQTSPDTDELRYEASRITTHPISYSSDFLLSLARMLYTSYRQLWYARETNVTYRVPKARVTDSTPRPLRVRRTEERSSNDK